MKTLELIPYVKAWEINSVEVEEELNEREYWTHDTDNIIYPDWNDDEELPFFKDWLIQNYGEMIKHYDTIAIKGT